MHIKGVSSSGGGGSSSNSFKKISNNSRGKSVKNVTNLSFGNNSSAKTNRSISITTASVNEVFDFPSTLVIKNVASKLNEKIVEVNSSANNNFLRSRKGGGVKSTDGGKNTPIKYKFDYELAYKLSQSSRVIKNDSMNDNWSEFVNSLKNTKYKSVEGFNKYVADSVNTAGYGTVDGILAAINTLAYDYPRESGNKFFYTSDLSITMRDGIDGIVPGATNMDCRAFVQWAIYNGGFDADIVNYRTNFQDWGSEKGIIMSDINSAKPGDIFSGDGDGSSHGGHIWMIVGNYDDGYYVAEEFGSNNGLVINKYSFDEHKVEVDHYNAKGYDMSSYYNNMGNVRKVNL